MNCVGIDVSKGKSMIAVMRPFGEVVVSPFEVLHTDSELSELARLLKSLDGETRVVMEATGNYHAPVAWLLHDAGLYVSVVNAMLVHDYGNNSLRRAKTDKKDAVKLANYGLDHWLTLPRYVPDEDTRLMLKTCYRQYQQYSKVQTMLKNNLISLLDTTFPDANRLFASPPRADGSEKWVDFVDAFWHCECVCGLSEKTFITRYQKWCRKHGYNFNENKALDIYASACGHFGVMPKTDTTKLLVEQAISQLRATSAALAALKQEMQSLAASLPEYPVVMGMFGVGPSLGPQLMAEIGDVRRFHSKKALVAFAGIDAPPYQSGQMDVRSRSISKRGSASLRRTLFLVMSVILQRAPMDEPVYQFMSKKHSEGKPYRVYMMASANKFLRIYYASVKAYSTTKEPEQVKRLIGVSPQETAVAPNLSVKENLELICGIHSFSKGKTEEKIRELSEQFALDTVLKCRLNFITRMQPLFPWAAFRSHSSKDTLLPGLHSDLFSSYPNRQDG